MSQVLLTGAWRLSEDRVLQEWAERFANGDVEQDEFPEQVMLELHALAKHKPWLPRRKLKAARHRMRKLGLIPRQQNAVHRNNALLLSAKRSALDPDAMETPWVREANNIVANNPHLMAVTQERLFRQHMLQDFPDYIKEEATKDLGEVKQAMSAIDWWKKGSIFRQANRSDRLKCTGIDDDDLKTDGPKIGREIADEQPVRRMPTGEVKKPKRDTHIQTSLVNNNKL